jgi:hypothetical protein
MTTTQPDEGRTPLSDEELAEALDCVEQALTAPWEPSFVFGTTGSEALQRVRAEVDRLRAEVAGYRSAICFETTCTSCARTLDGMAGAEAERDALAAKLEVLNGKVQEFLADERTIAKALDKADDQNEKMRLLGLAEARKTMREYLGDDATARRACTAKSKFFGDDLLYTIGCGKEHGHRDPHYSFTAERGWVDGGIPFHAALGGDQEGSDV